MCQTWPGRESTWGPFRDRAGSHLLLLETSYWDIRVTALSGSLPTHKTNTGEAMTHGAGLTIAGISPGCRTWGQHCSWVTSGVLTSTRPQTWCTHRLLKLPFVALDLALQLVHQVLHASQVLPVLLSLHRQRDSGLAQKGPALRPPLEVDLVTHLVCKFLDPALVFPHPLEGLRMLLLLSIELGFQLPDL